jgi:hypothetical protein
MITLGELANSELDLMGAMTDEELLGALEPLSTGTKTFIRRIKQPRPASGRSDSRSEFERRLHLLPKKFSRDWLTKPFRQLMLLTTLPKVYRPTKSSRCSRTMITKPLAFRIFQR